MKAAAQGPDRPRGRGACKYIQRWQRPSPALECEQPARASQLLYNPAQLFPGRFEGWTWARDLAWERWLGSEALAGGISAAWSPSDSPLFPELLVPSSRLWRWRGSRKPAESSGAGAGILRRYSGQDVTGADGQMSAGPPAHSSG